MCPDKKRPAENTCRIVKGLDAVWAHFCPSKPCLPLSIDGEIHRIKYPIYCTAFLGAAQGACRRKTAPKRRFCGKSLKDRQKNNVGATAASPVSTGFYTFSTPFSTAVMLTCFLRKCCGFWGEILFASGKTRKCLWRNRDGTGMHEACIPVPVFVANSSLTPPWEPRPWRPQPP